MQFNASIDVVLSLPYLSDVLTQQAIVQNEIDDNDLIIVKSIAWHDERQSYIADCDLYRETIH